MDSVIIYNYGYTYIHIGLVPLFWYVHYNVKLSWGIFVCVILGA